MVFTGRPVSVYMNASSLLTWVTCFSHQRSRDLFWGHLKTRVNFRLEFTRFQRIFYAYKLKRSPTEKKWGPPKKISGDLLRKKALTNLLLIFQVFHEHSIDGSALLVLTESHLTRILGLKLGPAIRLRAAIQELKAITNCSDWILYFVWYTAPPL